MMTCSSESRATRIFLLGCHKSKHVPSLGVCLNKLVWFSDEGHLKEIKFATPTSTSFSNMYNAQTLWVASPRGWYQKLATFHSSQTTIHCLLCIPYMTFLTVSEALDQHSLAKECFDNHVSWITCCLAIWYNLQQPQDQNLQLFRGDQVEPLYHHLLKP